MGARLLTGNSTPALFKYLRIESSEEYSKSKSLILVTNLGNTSTGNSLTQISQYCQGRDIQETYDGLKYLQNGGDTEKDTEAQWGNFRNVCFEGRVEMAENPSEHEVKRKYPTITFNRQYWDVNNIKSPSHFILFGNLLCNSDRPFTNMHSRRLST